MIDLKNIRKSFGSLEVLKGIDLHIDKGEVVSIVGPSGAGKTTLLQIMGTLASLLFITNKAHSLEGMSKDKTFKVPSHKQFSSNLYVVIVGVPLPAILTRLVAICSA